MSDVGKLGSDKISNTNFLSDRSILYQGKIAFEQKKKEAKIMRE